MSFITTIDRIELSDKYKYVRTIYFTNTLYKVVIASNTIYDVGERVLFIPDRAILPVRLIKLLGLWDYQEDHGSLSGKYKNVVRPYYFNNDRDYFSYGLFIPLTTLQENNIKFDENSPISLDEQLGIKYLEKKNPYIFLGDEYLYDISINKSIPLDLEYCYKDFENRDIICEEYINGRQFYVTLDLSKPHPNAHQGHKCLHITGQNYGKYRFLSNTKRNINGNMFCIVADHNNFENYAIAILRNIVGKETKITFNLVLKTQAFGNTHDKYKHAYNEFVVTDIFIGSVPYGRYLTIDERNKFCKLFNYKTPGVLYSGPYNYELLYNLANAGSTPHYIHHTGVIVRAEDIDTRAVLYSEAARFRYIFHVKQ